jgi:hypothetical protein
MCGINGIFDPSTWFAKDLITAGQATALWCTIRRWEKNTLPRKNGACQPRECDMYYTNVDRGLQV